MAMIGRVRYSPARGVQVYEEGDLNQMHSAVSGDIAVYTDTLTETQYVLQCWDEIITAANEKVQEIVSRMNG